LKFAIFLFFEIKYCKKLGLISRFLVKIEIKKLMSHTLQKSEKEKPMGKLRKKENDWFFIKG
jgi:hypothetical protein